MLDSALHSGALVSPNIDETEIVLNWRILFLIEEY